MRAGSLMNNFKNGSGFPSCAVINPERDGPVSKKVGRTVGGMMERMVMDGAIPSYFSAEDTPPPLVRFEWTG